MKAEEFASILGAVLVLFVAVGFEGVLAGDAGTVIQIFIFSFAVIFVSVFAKKGAAYTLDASVRHRIWYVSRIGWKPKARFKKELPFGVILPLLFTLFSVGMIKVMTILTYESSALKHRAAKRFGFYSYTEMTDWHNGLIGAAGVVALLLLSVVSYIPDFELLSKMAAYYAFWSMVPVSNLDGTQIFFGSRILWTVLGMITLIFSLYALIL